MAQKECPLCGGTMQLKEMTITAHTPGNPQPTTRVTREWVCPDCDNFEEADEEEK